MDVEKFARQVGNAPESEIRWTLQNATNEVLMDIIISLLKLLKTYQVRCNDME